MDIGIVLMHLMQWIWYLLVTRSNQVQRSLLRLKANCAQVLLKGISAIVDFFVLWGGAGLLCLLSKVTKPE